MAIVSFTLNDEGVVAFQNALACTLRFSEDVSLDARRDKLVLSALNATKSAFVSFTFSSAHFFRYKYVGSARSLDRFFCVLYIRSLLSVFRGRAGGDANRGSSADSSIERCDVSIDDGPGQKSRFVAKLAWRNGITATHALPFEAKAPVVARFDKAKADNHWSISAHTLRRLMEHFGPKVELLDINTEGNQVVNLTCFTEKQYTKTEGILNMNLHTSIAVKMDDFDDVDVEDKHHIIINVKDFRAILQHACTTSGVIAAHYSEPWQPLRFSYDENGLFCQFILMTLGNKADSEVKKSKTRTKNTATARPALAAKSASSTAVPVDSARPTAITEDQPHPSLSAVKDRVPVPQPPAPNPAAEQHPEFEIRPQPAALSDARMETLYEDDSQWEPVNPDEDMSGFVQIEWDERTGVCTNQQRDQGPKR
ncbi:Rad9 [Niveomyces insectorum RCEF 264]|uniref:DNA repair protein rad9 n=1 Tax=Niveomyces insectorum RCEF 264 TaxID=1081102 RepID=A0A167Z459_9HYPO|nr:Rad9 [Niveomyces insectorum RCEF 264]